MFHRKKGKIDAVSPFCRSVLHADGYHPRKSAYRGCKRRIVFRMKQNDLLRLARFCPILEIVIEHAEIGGMIVVKMGKNDAIERARIDHAAQSGKNALAAIEKDIPSPDRKQITACFPARRRKRSVFTEHR